MQIHGHNEEFRNLRDLFGQSQSECILYGVCNEQGAAIAAQHAFLLADFEEVEQLVIEACDVEEHDRFGMQFQRLPGKNLEEFLEGAEAAGKDEEGVGEFSHEAFTGVHGVDDMQFLHALVGDFLVDEDVRDDADDAAVLGKGRIGDCAHETDVRTAVDQADVARGQRVSEFAGGFAVLGTAAFRGRTEDGDASATMGCHASTINGRVG